MSFNLSILKHSASEKLLRKIPLPIEEEPELIDRSVTQFQHLYDLNSKSAFAHGKRNQEKSADYKQKVLEVMKYEQRTPQEAQFLYDHIQNFSFFESFNERNPYNNLETQAFIQLCQKAHYEKHPAKKILYKEGDAPSGKVYLIVSGQVYTMGKGTEGNITENSSHNEVTTIYDTTTENTAENTPNNNSEGSPFQNTPNLGFGGLASFRMRRSSYRITSNSSSINSSIPEQRISDIKPGKSSRFSIFVANSNDFHEKESSQSSLSQLGQKLKEIQEEKNLQQSVPRQGYESLLKTSLLPNIQENNLNRENEEVERNKVSLDKAKKQRKKSNRFSSIERQNPQPLFETASENGFMKCKVQQGGFFGERALFSKQPRPSTVITATECEFLVISKKHFQEVSEKYDLKRRLVLDFMKEFIPDFEELTDNEIVDEMIHSLQEAAFERDTYIIRENEAANHLYLIYEGTCEVIKKVQIDETANMHESLGSLKNLIRVNPVSKEDLFICKTERGEFIGEECVFGDRGVYNLSVRAYSAHVKVFTIKKSLFKKFHARTKELLEKLFKNKRRSYVEIANQLILRKYPMLRILNYDKIDTKRDLLSSNYIRLVPKRSSELIPKVQHENQRRNLFRTTKNFFNPNMANSNANPLNSSFNLDTKYRLSTSDFNDKTFAGREEKAQETSKVEKSCSPTHKELKKKLGEFSRTLVKIKNQPQESILVKRKITIQDRGSTQHNQRTSSSPRPMKLEALTPYFKITEQNDNPYLGDCSSQLNSTQITPPSGLNVNHHERNVPLKLTEEQLDFKRQDSCEDYLKVISKELKEIRKLRKSNQYNVSPKKSPKLSSVENESKYSFTQVLEKMINAAKSRKIKRYNDRFTIAEKLDFEGEMSCRIVGNESGIPFQKSSMSTPRSPNSDYWSTSPITTQKAPLSGKLKHSKSSKFLIKSQSSANSYCGSPAEVSQDNKINNLFERNNEITDCQLSEVSIADLKIKRSEVKKRSNFYKRTLKNKAIKNAECVNGNPKEEIWQSEYFGKEANFSF